VVQGFGGIGDRWGGVKTSQKMKSSFFDGFYVMPPLTNGGHYSFLVEKNDAFTMGDRVMRLLSDMEMKSRIVTASRNFAKRYDFLSVDKELDRIYFPISVQ